MEELQKNLNSLKELLNEEIKKVVKKADITPVELENMTKTLCLIEKIKMVEDADESWEVGQSGGYYPLRSYGMSGRQSGYYDGMSGRQSGYYNDMSGRQSGYYDGMSGRRIRSASTGRYMSGDNMSGRNSGNSYGMPDPGYSGHSIKDRMVAKLESMYDEAKTDHERQIIDEWINRLTDEH